jgi:hypothetical protein
MAFCGNVVELVEKFKILEEMKNFTLWEEIQANQNVEVYVENSLIPELEIKILITIDIAIGFVNGEKVAFLFIKKPNDVYGYG